jgi:hypothetical protein
MMKKIAFTFSLIALATVLGCNGGAVRIAAPQMSAVIMGETSIVVFWEMSSTIENNSDFAGYNVYAYTDSSELLVDDGEELNKWNSQLVTDTTYQINGLAQDSIYYVQVRTVNTDDKVGGYNATTPFLTGSPRPEFTVTMNMADLVQPVNDSCAIRFSDAFIMSDSTLVDSAADAWVNTENDTVWLMSPDDHPAYGDGARNTLFTNIGQGDFDEVYSVTTEPNLAEADFVVDDIVVAKTEDGNYVKIYIESIDMQNNSVTILYAYQNIADFPYF